MEDGDEILFPEPRKINDYEFVWPDYSEQFSIHPQTWLRLSIFVNEAEKHLHCSVSKLECDDPELGGCRVTLFGRQHAYRLNVLGGHLALSATPIDTAHDNWAHLFAGIDRPQGFSKALRTIAENENLMYFDSWAAKELSDEEPF